jgi:hypothetical protein
MTWRVLSSRPYTLAKHLLQHSGLIGELKLDASALERFLLAVDVVGRRRLKPE